MNVEVNTCGVEVSVQQAAQILGVTERSIINYIRSRDIAALKVGKEWHVDHASLMVFQQKTGLSGMLDERSVQSQQSLLSIEQQKSIPEENVQVPLAENQMLVQMRETGQMEAEKLAYTPPSPATKQPSILNLKCFHVCRNAFQLSLWQEPIDSENKRVLHDLKNKVYEMLGSGYYSFDLQLKHSYYNQARCSAGALLALIHADVILEKRARSEIMTLEENVIPAIAALIRNIEKREKR